jgi:uncharacterized membrane protein YjdF
MKIRSGFVSNSSSSSFIIDSSKLNDEQKNILQNHIEFYLELVKKFKEKGYELNDWEQKIINCGIEGDKYGTTESDKWDIELKGNDFYCETIIDNFLLIDFLELLQFPGIRNRQND